MKSIELPPECSSNHDHVLIAADHTRYDYEAIVRNSKLIVDARNATRQIKQRRDKVVHC